MGELHLVLLILLSIIIFLIVYCFCVSLFQPHLPFSEGFAIVFCIFLKSALSGFLFHFCRLIFPVFFSFFFYCHFVIFLHRTVFFNNNNYNKSACHKLYLVYGHLLTNAAAMVHIYLRYLRRDSTSFFCIFV